MGCVLATAHKQTHTHTHTLKQHEHKTYKPTSRTTWNHSAAAWKYTTDAMTNSYMHLKMTFKRFKISLKFKLEINSLQGD